MVVRATAAFGPTIKTYTGVRSVDEQSIFVSFGFGYDVGQIVKDMPFEKRWELNAGKAWSQRKNYREISEHNPIRFYIRTSL